MRSDRRGPLVSIGMPVYNGAATLRRSIDSILGQDYKNIELIISDNASADETPEICKEYQEADQRIRYIHAQENMGAAWNFNRVLELAQGQYFMWAAHDDHRDTTYVSKCVRALESEPSAVLCHSHTEAYLEGQSEPIYIATLREMAGITDPVQRFMKALMFLPGTTVYGLMRCSVAKQLAFRKNCLAADVVFTHELSLYGAFIEIPEVLFAYVGRAERRMPAEEYEILIPGKRLPKWYLPFLVLAWNHGLSILRSPLDLKAKCRLIIFLIHNEIDILLAKAGLLACRFLGISLGLNAMKRIVDRAMYGNPNIQWLVGQESLPTQHRPISTRFSISKSGCSS